MTDAGLQLNTPDSTEFRRAFHVGLRKVTPARGVPLLVKQSRAIKDLLSGFEPRGTSAAQTTREDLPDALIPLSLRTLREERGADAVGILLSRIAPTAAALTNLMQAEHLIGALYGPERQKVWLTIPMNALNSTPLEYLTACGPDGWTRILFVLNGQMQGGSDASQADREWATQRLDGHKLQIRR